MPTIVKLLIEAGAEVNCLDSHHGTTPLMMAIQRHYLEIAKVLLQSQANVNVISKPDPNSFFVGEVNQVTALHLAVETRQIEIVKMLVDAGADSKILDSNNCSPLDLAIAKGYTDIVALF